MAVFRIDMDSGHIDVGRHTIGRIISEAVDYFDGKIMLSSSRGKVITQGKKAGTIDKTDYFDFNFADGNLEISINVVIRFGNSISKITDQFIKQIQKELSVHLEMEAYHISITITGILSKQLAKRNIRIDYYNDSVMNVKEL